MWEVASFGASSTPRQHQMRLRAACSLGQPRPIGETRLAEHTACPCASTQVGSLMCAVRAAWSIPRERQRLVFGGAVLEEDRAIDSVPGLLRVFKLWPR